MGTHLIEKLDNNIISVSFDERGSVLDFGCFSLEGLHIASMKKYAVRGNHVHDKRMRLYVLLVVIKYVKSLQKMRFLGRGKRSL